MYSANKATTIASGLTAAAVLFLAACGGGGGDVGSNGRDETPIINRQPNNATVTSGEVATFSVAADGNRLHYTWLRDGQPIVGSPDRPQYSITATYKDGNHLFSVLIINDAGQVTSQGGLLTLALTPDEKLIESELLNGGYYSLSWFLSDTATQTAGTDYFFGNQTTLPQSPLNIGPVNTLEGFANVSRTLPFNSGIETPTIISNEYQFEANFGSVGVSYDGNGIEVQDYPPGSTLLGRSYTRSNYTFVPLTGPLSSSPTQLKELLGIVFTNPAVLDQTVTWQPGSGYITYQEVASNNQFIFQDCNGQPATATPTTGQPVYVSPCPVTPGGDITATMQAGIPDPVNNVVHVLADGTVITMQGTSVWVAAAPNPPAYPGQTVNFLAYAQSVSGAVFQGYVIRQGTLVTGGTGGPHFRVNPAAFATLQQASKI